MYRDNNEALQSRTDSLSREAELLRQENEAMRASMAQSEAMPALPGITIYQTDILSLPMGERARLANHRVSAFPVWAIGILHIITLGLFPLIHFGLLQDRLPRAAHNDPSAGKAIGFQFIPFYSLYWIFFSSLRLCDRLDLQFKLRGQAPSAPKGLMITACIFQVIPYGFIIALPIFWTIAVCVLQSKVNQVAALDPREWDASEQKPTATWG